MALSKILAFKKYQQMSFDEETVDQEDFCCENNGVCEDLAVPPSGLVSAPVSSPPPGRTMCSTDSEETPPPLYPTPSTLPVVSDDEEYGGGAISQFAAPGVPLPEIPSRVVSDYYISDSSNSDDDECSSHADAEPEDGENGDGENGGDGYGDGEGGFPARAQPSAFRRKNSAFLRRRARHFSGPAGGSPDDSPPAELFDPLSGRCLVASSLGLTRGVSEGSSEELLAFPPSVVRRATPPSDGASACESLDFGRIFCGPARAAGAAPYGDASFPPLGDDGAVLPPSSSPLPMTKPSAQASAFAPLASRLAMDVAPIFGIGTYGGAGMSVLPDVHGATHPVVLRNGSAGTLRGGDGGKKKKGGRKSKRSKKEKKKKQKDGTPDTLPQSTTPRRKKGVRALLKLRGKYRSVSSITDPSATAAVTIKGDGGDDANAQLRRSIVAGIFFLPPSMVAVAASSLARSEVLHAALEEASRVQLAVRRGRAHGSIRSTSPLPELLSVEEMTRPESPPPELPPPVTFIDIGVVPQRAESPPPPPQENFFNGGAMPVPPPPPPPLEQEVLNDLLSTPTLPQNDTEDALLPPQSMLPSPNVEGQVWKDLEDAPPSPPPPPPPQEEEKGSSDVITEEPDDIMSIEHKMKQFRKVHHRNVMLLLKQQEYSEALSLLQAVVDKCRGDLQTLSDLQTPYPTPESVSDSVAPPPQDTVAYSAGLLLGSTLHNVGIVQMRSEDHAHALDAFEEAISLRRGGAGPDHPLLSDSLAERAAALAALDRRNEALEMLAEAMDARTAAYGFDHPYVAKIFNDIGCVHFVGGDLDAARAAFENALDLQRSFSAQSPKCAPALLDIATSLGNLAVVYVAREEFRSAAVVLQDALVIQCKVLNNSNPVIWNTLHYLSLCKLRSGKFQSSIQGLEKLLELQRRHRSDDHFLHLSTLIKLSEANSFHEKYDTAINLLKEVLDIQANYFDPRGPEMESTVKRMLELHEERLNHIWV